MAFRKFTRRDGRRRWGIAHLLVLLVLLALVPFVVLEIYRGVHDVDRRRQSVTERARTQANEKADRMDDFLRFTERFLATLGATPAVQTFDAPAAEALFQAARRGNPNYENIFLLTAGGTQRASTQPAVSDPEVAQRPYFQEALSSGRMAISGVLAWPGTGRSVVVLAYPVTTPDGSRIGVLAIALNVARLSRVIGYVGLPAGSIVVLAQQDGIVIAASEQPEVWVGQSLVGHTAFEQSRSGAGGGETSAMVDGVSRVFGYQALGRAPWLMLAGVPQSEVEAEVQRSLLRIAEQMALAALATAVLAVIVLRRVVVPIRMLSEGARAYAAGFLNRRIPLHRDDELGDLSGALNSMAASLERRLEEEAAHAEALRRLNRLQREFVATASHELRTPVTAIRSYAEALMRPDIVDEQTRRECLEGIDRSSERLARLVRTLLDVSRIDSGAIAVALAPVDAAAVAHAAATAVPGPGTPVRVDAPPDLPPVQADGDRLEDVLSNLIGNARKFSPAGAPVTITLRRSEQGVTLAVADQGVGIPPEELPRIFDRFYQVQRGADRRTGGAGLGLYIARAYVTAMGGRIWAESTPGAGSTFFITLPVAEPIPEPGPPEDQHAGVAHAARGG